VTPSLPASESKRHTGPCTQIDPRLLQAELDGALAQSGLDTNLRATHPHLFSASTVFVKPADQVAMCGVIRATEDVIAKPAYRERVLTWAPATALHDPGTPGVFLGFDFHLDPDGPRLIEINTNAGGALLNLALLRSQINACAPLRDCLPGTGTPDEIEAGIIDMFRQEWRQARGESTLTRIAIVDDAPAGQFLHPEFVQFQELFRRHGIDAVIADGASLHVRDGRLRVGELAVDLVYNRLTDFALDEPEHAVLRQAYLEDLALITPHPRAHALYADKRNLALLTDADALRGFGIPEPTIDILARGIAHTRVVERAQAEALWAERKKLFFKPVSGYGSKAVYRGDKLTRRVWEEILAGDYVAQSLVAPAEQMTLHDQDQLAMKYDVRLFVYAGRVQLVAARLYRGQTTNFRTPGGGFAPVFYPPADG
jgi:hypothetical protein